MILRIYYSSVIVCFCAKNLLYFLFVTKILIDWYRILGEKDQHLDSGCWKLYAKIIYVVCYSSGVHLHNPGAE